MHCGDSVNGQDVAPGIFRYIDAEQCDYATQREEQIFIQTGNLNLLKGFDMADQGGLRADFSASAVIADRRAVRAPYIELRGLPGNLQLSTDSDRDRQKGKEPFISHPTHRPDRDDGVAVHSQSRAFDFRSPCRGGANE